jgi:putative transposase
LRSSNEEKTFEMKTGWYSEEQIIGVKQMEAGRTVKDLAREVGVSEATLYTSKSKYGGLDVNEARRLKELDDEKSPAEAHGGRSQLGQRGVEGADSKKRLELVGWCQDVALVVAEFGFSERRACKLMGMDRTSHRYQPRPDHNATLHQELIVLARQRPRLDIGGSRFCWSGAGSKRVPSDCIGSIVKNTWRCGG